MADYKELESVDEIFRKSFDALQDTPSASGWDTPSDQVWSQVQSGIGSRDTGWTTTQKVLAGSAIALALAAILYVSFRKQPAPSIPAPDAATVVTPDVVSSPPANVAPAPVEEKAVKTIIEKKKPVARPAAPATNSSGIDVRNTLKPAVSIEQPADNSTPAQNSTPKPPNSIERKKLKDQEKKDGQH